MARKWSGAGQRVLEATSEAALRAFGDVGGGGFRQDANQNAKDG